MAHPVIDLGADVQMFADGAAWQLGADKLGVDTTLGSSGESGYAWARLDCHLVEASWAQGGPGGLPDQVVPRPDAGTADLRLADPDLALVPPADPAAGIRPGRALRLVDRADGRLLWSGTVETVTHDAADPMHWCTMSAVDAVTRLSRAATMSAARGQETAYARATWLLTTYLPAQPRKISTAATQPVTLSDSMEGGTLWAALVDCADAETSWLWIRRDGTVDLLPLRDLTRVAASWALPACSPTGVGDVTQDLMQRATVWEVTRRSKGGTDVPVKQTARNTATSSAYGDWIHGMGDFPGADDPQALQAAQLGARWHGGSTLTAGRVNVNGTAWGHDPQALAVARALVRDAQLGDAIDPRATLPAGLQDRMSRLVIVGWDWTWSGTGGLSGTLTTLTLPVNAFAGIWALGLSGVTELGTTTILGG